VYPFSYKLKTCAKNWITTHSYFCFYSDSSRFRKRDRNWRART